MATHDGGIKSTTINGVKMYTIASQQPSRASWLPTKKERSHRIIKSYTENVQLLEDLRFTTATTKIKATPDGEYIIASEEMPWKATSLEENKNSLQQLLSMDPNFGVAASCSNVTEENLNRYRHFVNEILTKVQRLEKQVNEVDQFYNPTDGVQVNHYKGRGMHLSGTKKPILQGGSSREVLGMQELMHRFATILDEITQDSWAEPFLEPVDVKGLDLYDYYEIIEKPMDFSTIRRKMDAKDGSGYKNVREIYSDVRLIFKNAMKYNDRKHDIHVMAKNLLEKFEKKWLQLLPKVVEAESERLAEERLNAHIAQEANCANMAREISFELGEVDTDLKNLKAMVIENCRKLSAQGKVTLGTALTKLSHENLMRAMEIVSENNPTFQPDVEEVNLDIDAQSDYTLWRLNIFVKSTLEVQGRTPADTVANQNSNVEEERSKKRRRV